MGGAVGTGSWQGNRKERDHLEGLGIDGRKILKWNFKKQDGGVDWISLAQVRDMWRALVNTAMNLRVL